MAGVKWLGYHAEASFKASLLQDSIMTRFICPIVSSGSDAVSVFGGRQVQPYLEYKVIREWVDCCLRNHHK